MTNDALRSVAQLSLPFQVDVPLATTADARLDAAPLDDDAASRARSLDVEHSFIVRAPAGLSPSP